MGSCEHSAEPFRRYYSLPATRSIPFVICLPACLPAPPAVKQQRAATPEAGVRDQYYGGSHCRQLVLTRQTQIDFNWTTDRQGNYFAAPGPGVPRAGFLVRLLGFVRAPKTGAYVRRTTRDNAHDLHLAGGSVVGIAKYEPAFF